MTIRPKLAVQEIMLKLNHIISHESFKAEHFAGSSGQMQTGNVPDRRQLLIGVSALLTSTALPVSKGTASHALRSGGWILRESDTDVS